MHLEEGFTSLPLALGGAAVTAAGLAYGLSKLHSERMPRTAAVAAAFFVGSLVHVPMGGGCSAHLLLNGLAGLALGPLVFPAIFIGLLLQAAFFQFGGLLSLGVNTMNMALPGLLVYFLFRRLLRISVNPKLVFLWGALAGSLAVTLSCLMLVSCLLFAQQNAGEAAKLLFYAHLPVILIEGFLSGALAVYLKRVQPELFMQACES